MAQDPSGPFPPSQGKNHTPSNESQDTISTEFDSEGVVGGHYRLIKSLGAGGMGTIFYGVHILTDQPVAIKVLHTSLCDDPIVRSRFLAEARTLAALEHPNIVQWKNSIEERGQLYLIMQFVDGENVEKRLEKRGQLPISEAVPIVVQALMGLVYVHSKNIVHRDIKPSNILIRPDGEVKLADFGIAKFAGMPKHTQTGMTIGTYQYMSPEQVMGKELDMRSDIYSMGITLFEMITGKPPFEGETEFDICRHHIETDLPSVKRYDSRMNKILRKAAAKEPKNRYQTAADFMNDLLANFREYTRDIPSPWVKHLPPPAPRKGCLGPFLWFVFWFSLVLGAGYYLYFYVWDAPENVPSHHHPQPSPRTAPRVGTPPSPLRPHTAPGLPQTRQAKQLGSPQRAVPSQPARPVPPAQRPLDRKSDTETSPRSVAVLPPQPNILFQELFQTNQMGWPTGEHGGTQIHWNTGQYLVQTALSGQHQIPLCPSRLPVHKAPLSVTIEAQVQRADKVGHAIFGVNLFNHPQLTQAQGYYVAINPPHRMFTVTRLNQQGWHYMKPWTISPDLRSQGINQVKITLADQQLVLQINEGSHQSIPATTYTQGRICLFVQQGGAQILFHKFSLADETKKK